MPAITPSADAAVGSRRLACHCRQGLAGAVPTATNTSKCVAIFRVLRRAVVFPTLRSKLLFAFFNRPAASRLAGRVSRLFPSSEAAKTYPTSGLEVSRTISHRHRRLDFFYPLRCLAALSALRYGALLVTTAPYHTLEHIFAHQRTICSLARLFDPSFRRLPRASALFSVLIFAIVGCR